MPYSDDDFGGDDDDDEELLAAATQVEQAQQGDFAASPRASKKRRITPGPFVGNNAITTSASIATFDQENAPETDNDYYFPGELGSGEQSSGKSKYKIRVGRGGTHLPHQIFSQTQHNLDEDPTHIRGAVWKRPQSLPGSATTHTSTASSSRYGTSSGTRTILNNLTNYFERQDRPVPLSDVGQDAAVAVRLQTEEEQAGQAARKPQQTMQQSLGSTDAFDDLVNLPSDAFPSSIGEKSQHNEVILLSSQEDATNSHPRHLRGPQAGLKQMTIFGQAATQALTDSQAAKKRHAWPLSSRDEAPTHHKLDEAAMATWVYPTNLGTIRDYQFNIVSRSLFHNTLVALPTGLGKTFIAATVMLNYFRWTTDAQLIFMAPTKPLIAQQMEACYQIVGIPRGDTILMTGETSPGHRAAEWLEKRVFFMTPQTVINDLKTGICDPKKIVLLVVDEAHKATGGYAYTEVVSFLRRFNNSFRVLALTATPGSSVETVQEVIDNLGIARVELRTESSLDIRQYTHEKQTETEVFEFSDEQGRVMEMVSAALKPVVDKLCSQNVYWSRDPMQLTAFGLMQARGKWAASEAGRRAPMGVKGMVNAAVTVLSSIAHNIGLLKFHGIRPFYSGLLAFQKTVDSGQSKGKSATQIVRSEDFVKMMAMIRVWTNNPDFLGHPKLEYLRSVVLNHFLDAGEGRHGGDAPPSATRVMVFVNYRDSAEEICRALKRNEPMIRPHVFVGQAASKGSEGMDQKRQNAVIQDFKSGKYNTLVATSIGEEGLDIGTVDLIVCYDASSSPIRMLQRSGRTGRKRIGRVVLLLMKGKEANDYTKALDNYSWIQKTIADESRYTYCDNLSPRIIPKHFQPIVDRRIIDIPVENSQPIDLNEKNRRGRGKAKLKRPPKKFHMPDGVQTGFVKASKIGSADADETDGESQARSKTAAKTKNKKKKTTALPPRQPEPEVVQIPFLNDVLLKDREQIDLEQKYAHTSDMNAEMFIKAPDTYKFSSRLRDVNQAKYIAHGRATALIARTLCDIHNIDDTRMDRMEAAFEHGDLRDGGISLLSTVVQHNLVAVSEATVAGSASLNTVASSLPKVTKARGRPRAQTTTRTRLNTAATTASQTKRPRGRPKKTASLQRAHSYGSAANECDESSPEPTPADMRLATQGIDLGSRDTSGEDDDDEELDSELDAFIARSSDPIEMASSSQPGARHKQGRRLQRKGQASNKAHRGYFTSSEDECRRKSESDTGPQEASEVNHGRVARARPRRIVADSDNESE